MSWMNAIARFFGNDDQNDGQNRGQRRAARKFVSSQDYLENRQLLSGAAAHLRTAEVRHIETTHVNGVDIHHNTTAKTTATTQTHSNDDRRRTAAVNGLTTPAAQKSVRPVTVNNGVRIGRGR